MITGNVRYYTDIVLTIAVVVVICLLATLIIKDLSIWRKNK